MSSHMHVHLYEHIDLYTQMPMYILSLSLNFAMPSFCLDMKLMSICNPRAASISLGLLEDTEDEEGSHGQSMTDM